MMLPTHSVPMPLFHASLGTDDTAVARQWLGRRAEWHDEATVAQFESAFAAWNGNAYAVAFMGGRVALSAALEALHIGPGDEVILPGYTCVVVRNALQFAVIHPVFADIELDSYGIDAGRVESLIGPKTRAIIVQHLYGLVSRDYEEVVDIARRRGLAVIEDCAQSAGASYRGRRVGHAGDIAIFSTEQSKHLNTIQGGLAVTNDAALAESLREQQRVARFPDPVRTENLLRSVLLAHATTATRRTWRSRMAILRHRSARSPSTTRAEERGEKPAHYGERMPAPIAALGLNQLAKVDRLNARRRDTARIWDEWCAGNGYSPAHVVADSVPSFLRYPVLVEPERKRDLRWLRDLNVNVGVWFTGKLHPVDTAIPGCERADEAVARCINFPCLAPEE